jgi:hypothetical protein
LQVQEADPGNDLRRLRLGRERCGEEAAGHSADERPTLHYSIT